jgi:hypothetical protein
MSGKRLTNEEKRKAVKVFKDVHGFEVVNNPAHCPKCLRKNGRRRMYCLEHRWAYEGWLGSGMITLIALRDRELQQALKTEGLWFDQN